MKKGHQKKLADQMIALVEDDPELREAIKVTLEMQDLLCVEFDSAEEAWESILREPPELIITDFRLPGMSGLNLLQKVRAAFPKLPVIIMTAHADTTLAVEALRFGANDFLIKPFLPKHLLDVLTRYRQVERNERPSSSSSEFIAVDPATIACVERLRRVAATDASVLLTGESGVGKDMFARQIHSLSSRSDRNFVAVNCAAIPETLLESTLFGHERGAFTNANRPQAGKFEQADGGTLFLDEIGEMPFEIQAKLLRVVQDQVVERLGSNNPIKCNVRIISATNQRLNERVKAGQFREDLFYRLNVFDIHIPPLRERQNDIIPLAEMLLGRYASTMGKTGAIFNEAARRALLGHTWPGNVRELENAIQRALLMSDNPSIDARHLEIPIPTTIQINPPKEHAGTFIAESNCATAGLENLHAAHDLASVERAHILAILAQVDGNRRKAAQILGLSERGLRYKLREYERMNTIE